MPRAEEAELELARACAELTNLSRASKQPTNKPDEHTPRRCCIAKPPPAQNSIPTKDKSVPEEKKEKNHIPTPYHGLRNQRQQGLR